MIGYFTIEKFNIAKSTFTLWKLWAKNVLWKNGVTLRVSDAVFNLYMQLFWFLLLVKWKLFQSQQQTTAAATAKQWRVSTVTEREKIALIYISSISIYTNFSSLLPIQWQINMAKSLCNVQQFGWIEFEFRKKLFGIHTIPTNDFECKDLKKEDKKQKWRKKCLISKCNWNYSAVYLGRITILTSVGHLVVNCHTIEWGC